MALFERASDLLKDKMLAELDETDEINQAIVRGEIAGELARQGRYDEALRIHREEELPVYERLGDERSAAITQGEIAEILAAQGDLGEAIRLYREDALAVLERLGAVSEATLMKARFARILLQRGAPADGAEAQELLAGAYESAQRLGLPEVEAIAALLREARGAKPESSDSKREAPAPTSSNRAGPASASDPISQEEVSMNGHNDTGPTPGRSQVFISYCHKDRKWLDLVQTHLKDQVRGGLVAWDDNQIAPGSQWREDIDRALASARVAILLVSPYFVASDFIVEKELPVLKEAAARRELTLLIVHVDPARLGSTGLDQVQAVNAPDRPLSSLPKTEQHRVMVKLANEVARLFAAPEEPPPSPKATASVVPPAGPAPADADARTLALDLLQRLLPGQFEEVAFRYGLPPQHDIRSVAQNERAINLLRFAEQREGAGVPGLLDAIRKVAPHLRRG